MKEKKSIIKKEHIALAVIIIAQLLTIFFVYRLGKDSHDTDEFYSYGLANSYKKPFLYNYSYNKEDGVTLYDMIDPFWMTGDDFKYYMRTNHDTAFRYDSVYYNQAKDTIPPLYYCILHTICSINTGKFSWYYALGINLVCLVITQIFTYLLAAKVTRSKFAALLVVAFWGFTLGGISNFIFLRMYAMLTMFGVIYTYLTVRLHTTKEPKLKDYVMIVLAAFLGAMTHHNFLIFAFFCTAFSCLFLLMQRAFKKFFCYGLSALIGIALSFAAFPATIDHLTMNMPWSDSMPFHTSLRFFSITLKLAYTGSYFFPTSWLVYATAVLIPLIAFSIPILFLFRDKPFVRSLPSKIKNGVKTTGEKLSDPDKFNPGGLILLLTVFSFLCVIAHKTYFLDLCDNAIRYVYMLIPLMITVIFGLVTLIVKKFKKKQIRVICSVICSAALVCSLVYQHKKNDIVYLYHIGKQGNISEYTKDMDCLLLVATRTNLQCSSLMVEDANEVFCSSASTKFQKDPKVLAEYDKLINKQQPFIVILDTAKYYTEEYLEELKKVSEQRKNDPSDEPAIYTAEDFDNRLFIDYDDIDKMQTEKGVIEYLENYSGYKATFCTKETSGLVNASAYLFTPQN